MKNMHIILCIQCQFIGREYFKDTTHFSSKQYVILIFSHLSSTDMYICPDTIRDFHNHNSSS